MALLVSLSDMKDYLGITNNDYDTFLTNQIAIVSDAIEGYCGRVFASASYVQTYYGQDYLNDALDPFILYTFHYPVTAITQIREIETLEDGSTNVTILDSAEYLIHQPSGKLYKLYKTGGRRSWFSEYGHHSKAEVTYTAGFASTPTPVEDVVFNLVEERYNKKVAGVALGFGNDVQRVSIPGVMSIDFDYTLQANERSSKFGMIVGNYANVLDQYATERSVIGEIKENYVS
jgi:hypothetical protein